MVKNIIFLSQKNIFFLIFIIFFTLCYFYTGVFIPEKKLTNVEKELMKNGTKLVLSDLKKISSTNPVNPDWITPDYSWKKSQQKPSVNLKCKCFILFVLLAC